MRTLVYFASGGYIKPEYENLNFDRIILIDNSFRQIRPFDRYDTKYTKQVIRASKVTHLGVGRSYFGDEKSHNFIFKSSKITCIGMDCLEAIEYLKKENIKIDCLVAINVCFNR